MGHHIDDQGRFQSDKHPELKPDHIVLDFRDPIAQEVIWIYACQCDDVELAQDIMTRLQTLAEELVKT